MRSNQRVKIVVTGGHSTPAVALIEEIQKKHPQWEIYYFGVKYPFEGKKILSYDYRVVSRLKGIRFIPLVTGRLQRRLTPYTFVSLIKIPLGFIMAAIRLLQIRPRVIVSFGGYLSVPVVIAGWLGRIPSLTHEQTLTLGLANKINSFFAKKVAVSFPEVLALLPKKKGVFTGPLLRSCLINKKDPGELSPVAQVKRETKRPFLYITGGKTGAHFINQLVFSCLSVLSKRYLIVHQTGEIDFFEAKKKRKKLAERKRFYWPYRYLADKEVGWVLNQAELVVSRAGANITSELLALKKRALLIPLPYSYQEEQKKNAFYFVSHGRGRCLFQEKANQKNFLSLLRELEKEKKKEKPLSYQEIFRGRQLLLREIEKILNQR